MSDWRIYAGAAALVGLVVWLRGRTSSPASSTLPEPPPGAPPERWVELDQDFVLLFTGDRYRACVDVPGLVPNSFVASRIPDRAVAFGFRDVHVQEGPPKGWPKSSRSGDCDLFVEATWNGADGRRVDRPSQVTGAWRLARA